MLAVILLVRVNQFLPLAVSISVQSPAGLGGRSLICNTEDLQTLPLWTTTTMTRQHGRIHTLLGWVLDNNTDNTKKMQFELFISAYLIKVEIHQEIVWIQLEDI